MNQVKLTIFIKNDSFYIFKLHHLKSILFLYKEQNRLMQINFFFLRFYQFLKQQFLLLN